jgi:hypothetical protein
MAMGDPKSKHDFCLFLMTNNLNGSKDFKNEQNKFKENFGYKKCLFHDLTIGLDNLFLNQKIKDLYDKKPFRRFVFRILNI